jgi:signal transduction histidine kinase
MMRERAASTPFVEDAARIEEGLNFCRHFVQRLLEFTRATPIQKVPQDLSSVVESVTGFFLPAIRNKRVSLAVDVSLARGCMVFADRNLLETLLLTLLSNALDAVPPDGEICVLCRQVAPHQVGFVIKDNGCGIAPANRDRVFEPFFTTKEPGKGTGLGLAIARNVVVEHGGTIHLQSEPGAGTAVMVDFPLAERTSMVSAAS